MSTNDLFTPSAQKKRRWQNSVVAKLCLVLGIGCLAIFFYPGHLDAADAVPPELRHYVAKVATFLSSKENPEIVILGSSLMLYPATLCDLEMEGKKPVDNDWYAAIFMPEYTQAKYLEMRLESESHRKRHITNLAVASSLMSDHSLLFDSIIYAGKDPQLIICGIAPRDFIDNNQPDSALTPVHKLLADIRPQLLMANSKPSIPTFLNNQVLHLKRAITCLRQSANHCFCLLAHRPDNDNAAKMVPGVLHLTASKVKDLATYDKVYNPMQTRRLTEQSACLTKMLTTANQSHIKVLLVNMPLTAENRALLPAPSLALYNQTVQDIANKNRTAFLDLQQSADFKPSDFIDSCHLNAQGGATFYKDVVQALYDGR